MPYLLHALDRQSGAVLGQAKPDTWSARYGINKTGSIQAAFRALDPLTAELRRVGQVMLELREVLPDGNPTRMVAEAVDARRNRTADLGGGMTVTAMTPDWRWGGIVLGNTMSADPDGQGNHVQKQPFLAPRGLTPSSGPGSSSETLDRSELAKRLVEATSYIPGDGEAYLQSPQQYQTAGLRPIQIMTGDTFRGLVTHDPGIRIGSITPSGGTVLLTPEDLWRRPANALMEQLAGGLDGFEWWLSYSEANLPSGNSAMDAFIKLWADAFGYDFTGRPAARTFFNCAPSKGVNRPDVFFEYGGGSANVEDFEEHLDFTTMVTHASVPPPGAPTSEIDGTEAAAFGYDYAQALKYGARDRIVTADVSARATRQQLVAEVLEVGARPKQTIALTLAPRGANTPWPFVDFELGDRVRFVSWEGDEELTRLAPVRAPLATPPFSPNPWNWYPYPGPPNIALSYDPQDPNVKWGPSTTKNPGFEDGALYWTWNSFGPNTMEGIGSQGYNLPTSTVDPISGTRSLRVKITFTADGNGGIIWSPDGDTLLLGSPYAIRWRAKVRLISKTAGAPDLGFRMTPALRLASGTDQGNYLYLDDKTVTVGQTIQFDVRRTLADLRAAYGANVAGTDFRLGFSGAGPIPAGAEYVIQIDDAALEPWNGADMIDAAAGLPLVVDLNHPNAQDLSSIYHVAAPTTVTMRRGSAFRAGVTARLDSGTGPVRLHVRARLEDDNGNGFGSYVGSALAGYRDLLPGETATVEGYITDADVLAQNPAARRWGLEFYVETFAPRTARLILDDLYATTEDLQGLEVQRSAKPVPTIDASLRVYGFEISGNADGTETVSVVVADDGS